MKPSLTESPSLSAASRQALECAERESRQFNHAYVGTEHLLLGLLCDANSSVVAALKSLGVAPADIRREIESICPPGAEPLSAGPLPLTPRAGRVVILTIKSAKMWHQSQATPEHLFLNLLQEPQGVAARVLLSLGLKPDDLRREALKVRLAQVKIVERAVRPIRAGTDAKRKMRDELLAHLGAIYEEESKQRNDPGAALEAAAARFGDPAELSRDLQRAQPLSQRLNYRMEQFLGWRAPESATRYMARVAAFVLTAMALSYAAALAVATDRAGLPFAWIATRPIFAMMIILPSAQFIVGCLYYMMRDAIWGVFGSRQSNLKALLLALAIAASVTACFLGYFSIASGNLIHSEAAMASFIPAAVITAIVCYRVAATRGLTEIADTHWACLEI